MERLPNGMTLSLPAGTFPLSTDSMVLADFVRLPRAARVLDLGSGCGTLGLLLCSGAADCHVTGVELTENAHLAALDNIRRNGLEDRMVSLCGDIRGVDRLFPPGGFSVCLSNPPYFSGGPASAALPLARREDAWDTASLFRAAAWGLKYGGDFYIVHRPERLAALIAGAAPFRLEAKRLLLLRHRASGAVNLICLAFRKGGRPGLKLEEQCLFHPDGSPTEYYRRVYHTQTEGET